MLFNTFFIFFYFFSPIAGAHPSKSLKTSEQTSDNIYTLGMENQVGPPSREKLDYDPVLGQNLSFMPLDYLKTSVIGSSSALPETNLQIPPVNLENCKNNQVPFSTPFEKPVRQHVSTPSDSIPAMKSSPGIVIRPPAVGACSSASNSISFKNVNTNINATDTDLTGISPSDVKEAHYSLNFGSKNEFDRSRLSFHLDGNCYLSGESLSTNTEKLSTTNMASKDATDHLFGAKPGVNFSDNFSLALDNNRPVMAVENSLESLDHYNPPVDSPCWKGAIASHNSPFGSSEAVAVQLAKKLEACDISNGQALKLIPTHATNVVKPPSGKPGKQKKDYVLFSHSMGPREKASCSIQKSLAEGRLTSNNVNTSETGVVDLEMKINDVSSGFGSSYMSCHAIKIPSILPSSVEDASAKHSKFLGKEAVSNSSISVLVDTIHNLSELLLYHCCSETSELKEQDLKSLEKVINNVDSCMSKNIGQESFLSELHESTTMGRAQVAAINDLSQHVQEKVRHSGKKDKKCSDFVSVKSATDIKVKNDEMTQAIKKVLIENFHEKEEAHPQVLLYKNLWLEAEAALCSINYMARYNNMKIEIEKRKLDSEKDLLEDTPDKGKMSRSEFCTEVKTNEKLTAVAESGPTLAVSNQNPPIESPSNHADDVTARYVLKHRLNNSGSVHSRDVDDFSSSKLSLDVDEVDKLTTEVKDSSSPGLLSQDSPVLGTACSTDDVEASVMTRFHILKRRGIDGVDSDEMEKKLLPDVVDLGFDGERKEIPIDKKTAEDGISGVNLESVSQHQVVNHGEQLVVKDFHLSVVHDSAVNSPGSTRLGNQLSAGWYDSCSSDWEHVLKEEFSGQNS
ncbi:hypothetical protein DITRI_Ditri07aG0106100 [Diplodiscus trichospermus]